MPLLRTGLASWKLLHDVDIHCLRRTDLATWFYFVVTEYWLSKINLALYSFSHVPIRITYQIRKIYYENEIKVSLAAFHLNGIIKIVHTIITGHLAQL